VVLVADGGGEDDGGGVGSKEGQWLAKNQLG